MLRVTNMLSKLAEFHDVLTQSPIFQMSLSSKELFHSNFIAWLAEKYPDEMSKVFGANGRVKKVEREKKNIDLTLHLSNGKKIIIENKVKSIPYADQLNRYNKACSKTDIFILLTLIEPAFDQQTAPNWSFLHYEQFVDNLKKKLIESGAVINTYHQKLVEDYISFVSSLVGISNLCRVGSDTSTTYKVTNEINEALKGLRINDLIQKMRISEIEYLLRNRPSLLGLKIGEGIKPHNNEQTQLGKFGLASGFTRGSGLLDLKYVYSKEPFVLIGVQLQGSQLRCFVESDDLEVSEKSLAELKTTWIDPFIERMCSNSAFFEKSQSKKPYCRFGAFLYQYVKVKESVTVNELLDAFESSIVDMRSLPAQK